MLVKQTNYDLRDQGSYTRPSQALGANEIIQTQMPPILSVLPSEESEPHSVGHDLSKDISGSGEYLVLDEQWRAMNRKDSYNEELQFYSPDNVDISGNSITIYSREEIRGDKMYTSGLIESNYSYLYGSFEFTFEIPEGQGLFPAIWLMPQNKQAFPEVDIFEALGSKPDEFYGVVHFLEKSEKKRDYFHHAVLPKENYKVRLEWEETQLSWFIDDECIYQTSKGIPTEPMYLIINLAVGGVWPGSPDDGTVFPAEFIIKAYAIEPEWKEER